MSKARMEQMDTSPPADDLPPSGTAIVRPLRHVRAVRARYMLRFTDPAQAATSRSARAWSWALGETAIAPVTDRRTTSPPSRSDIDAEINAADERRLRDDEANRSDAAATILRWLIGADDHVPARGENPGELVDGFGDIVHSRRQITHVLGLALKCHERASSQEQEANVYSETRRFTLQDVDYLGGVAATLRWVLGDQAEAPITHRQHLELTTKSLKQERLSADDVIEQARYPWMADRLKRPGYGEGVKLAITWLLGDTTVLPIDHAG